MAKTHTTVALYEENAHFVIGKEFRLCFLACLSLKRVVKTPSATFLKKRYRSYLNTSTLASDLAIGVVPP